MKLPEDVEVRVVAGVGKHPATWVVAEKIWTLKTPNGFNGGFDSNHLLYVASIPTSLYLKGETLGAFVARFFNVGIWFQVKYFMGFLPEGDEGLAAGGWWILRQGNLG